MDGFYVSLSRDFSSRPPTYPMVEGETGTEVCRVWVLVETDIRRVKCLRIFLVH